MIRQLGRPGDLGWVIQSHGEMFADEFCFETRFEALNTDVVAAFAATRSDRERAWIADVDGRRAGCVFCVDAGDGTALLRGLLVMPAARGRGLGAGLVDTCLAFAREAGYRQVRLWTVDPLVAARRIYLARGFRLVGSAPHDGFGVPVTGETYALELEPSSPR